MPEDKQEVQKGYHYVIVPDPENEDDDATPKRISCASQDELLISLYSDLMVAGKGWVYVFLNGIPAKLSNPQQVFQLKLDEGPVHKELTVSGNGSFSFTDGGRFFTLKGP